MRTDGAPNTVHVFVDVGVAHADDRPALLFEIFGAARVIRQLIRCGVRGAIDFDDELRGYAGKVRDVGTDGMLAAKASVVHGALADVAPEESFRARHLAAKLFGEGP